MGWSRTNADRMRCEMGMKAERVVATKSTCRNPVNLACRVGHSNNLHCTNTSLKQNEQYVSNSLPHRPEDLVRDIAICLQWAVKANEKREWCTPEEPVKGANESTVCNSGVKSSQKSQPEWNIVDWIP